MNSDTVTVLLSPDGRVMTIEANGQCLMLNRDEVFELIEKINAHIGAMPSKQNET